MQTLQFQNMIDIKINSFLYRLVKITDKINYCQRLTTSRSEELIDWRFASIFYTLVVLLDS